MGIPTGLKENPAIRFQDLGLFTQKRGRKVLSPVLIALPDNNPPLTFRLFPASLRTKAPHKISNAPWWF